MRNDLYYYDANWLVERSPYMRLISEQAAKCFLDEIYVMVNEYGYLLKNYPEEKYAQVDPLYFIHQSLCLLDVHLAADFFKCSYRGACWGSLLIAINPNEKYLGLIKDFLETCHHKNQWIAKLALCAITKQPCEYQDKITMIHEKFKLLKQETITLRLSPNKEEQAQHSEEMIQIQQCYQSHGAEAARRLLKTTTVYQYHLNYIEFLNSEEGT